MAHELGHGAFTLKHTFADNNALPQGTTDNLMDYHDGTHLWKLQWDRIHDPATVLGLFEGDEAGASVAEATYETVEDPQDEAIIDKTWFYFNKGTRYVKIAFLKPNISSRANTAIYQGKIYLLLYTGNKFLGFYKEEDLKLLPKTEENGITSYAGKDLLKVNQLTRGVHYSIIDEGDLTSHTVVWMNKLRLREDISREQLDKLVSLINKFSDESLNYTLSSNPANAQGITPCGGKIDVGDLTLNFSKECWESIINSLAKNADTALKRCESILALVNKVTISDEDRNDIKTKFKELTALDYGFFSAADRIKLLSYFASGSMEGTYFGVEGTEGFALKLLKYADANQADAIIRGLEAKPVIFSDTKVNIEIKKLSGSLIKNLSSKINDGIWGVGGNNSKALSQVLTYILGRSVNEFQDRQTKVTPEVIFVQNSYLSPDNGEPILHVRYMLDGDKEISVAQGRWVVERKCEWINDFGSDGYEECTIVKQEVNYDPEIRLRPFDLIIVAKESDITLIEGIKPLRVESQSGTVIVIPALAAEYAYREGDMRNIALYVENSLNALTLLVPFSKVANAPTWINRFFKFTDIFTKGNAVSNLIVNNTDLSRVPEVRAVLDSYNKITLALNVINLTSGLSRTAVSAYIRAVEKSAAKKALHEAAKNGSKEAQELLDAAEEFKSYGQKQTGNKEWWKEDVAEGVAKGADEIDNLFYIVKNEADFQGFRNLCKTNPKVSVELADGVWSEFVAKVKSDYAIAADRNLAKITFDGQEYLVVSGKKFNSQMVNSNKFIAKEFVEQVESGQRVFSPTIATRHLDTEYIGLEFFAKQKGAVKGAKYPEVTGELRLTSDLCPCPSCSAIFQQFSDMFPNVNIKIVTTTKLHY
ncbi:MAG: hypothetical protein JSS79_19780 [Bacteroidetes bacterium]|nr:hypothetical protein [Bacteroidota bacterium]